MRRPIAIASLILTPWLGGCGSRSASVDVAYPDRASYDDKSSLSVIAVEPFGPGEDGIRDRVLVQCGQLGVFPPTARYLVNSKTDEVASFPPAQILKGRTEAPADSDPDTWDFEVNPFVLGSDANPWKALLLHFEARAKDVYRYDARLLEPGAETILEGCACLRFEDSATSSDRQLDQEVKAACPSILAADGSDVRVDLHAIAPQSFRLEPCGVTELVGPKNLKFSANPGVCLRPLRCGSGTTGQSCFTCATDACNELDNKQNVPVRFSLEQPGGNSQMLSKLVLTNVNGVAVPDIQLDDCAVPITLHAELVGRPESRVDFPIRCVPSVTFGDTPDLRGAPCATGCERNVEIHALDRLPGEPSTREPDRVVVASNDGVTARLEVFEAVGAEMLAVDTATFASSRILGAHGYYYQLDPPGRPLLAVAVANERSGLHRLETHIYRWASGQLEEVALGAGGCRHLGCAQPDICDEPTDPLFACGLDSTSLNRVSFDDADVNGDGLADLAIGSAGSFAFMLYHSNSRSPEVPPALDANCQCSSFGLLLPNFSLLKLGGPHDNPLLANVDMLVGDGRGAYVRYEQSSRVDGPPCPGGSDDCPSGLVCEQMCASGSPTCGCDRNPSACDANCGCDPLCTSRCVEPCRVGVAGACSTSPLRTTCVESAPGNADGYCAGPGLGCSQPSMIWPLVTVQHITKGRLSQRDRFEDGVVIAAGGSGAGTGGARDQVRVVFGSEVDLTNTNLPASIKDTSSVYLAARQFPGEEVPSVARSAHVADFNADGFDDLAVLYSRSEEIRIWLGGARGLEELPSRAVLKDCVGACSGGRPRCYPYNWFTSADVNKDGRAELFAICAPSTAEPTHLIGFTPAPE